ncbi:hypothetical protein OH705_28160, partial [Pseudomonas sp. BJa3]|nr:hypothetical protein [Pseudomonas sp. BJa3]
VAKFEGSFVVILIWLPPMKSIPKFKPGFKNRKIEASDKIIEMPIPMKRAFIKRKVVFCGMMLKIE